MTKSAKKLARRSTTMSALTQSRPPLRARFPHFVALPDVLAFPNLEIILFVFMASSVTEVCASIVAAYGAGSVDDGPMVGLALACLLLVAFVVVHEVLRIRRFYRRHKDLFVAEEEPLHPSEVDDPLLYSLAKCRLIKPRSRVRGGYEPREDDNEEPDRTERLLSRPLALWRHRKAGDEYVSMATLWLSDVGSGIRGTYYQITKIILLLLSAFVAGIGFDADPGSSRAHAQAWLLITIQVVLALYCLFICYAGDRLEGTIAGLEAVCQAIKLLCDYRAAGIDRTAVAEAWAAANTTNATTLAEIEAGVLEAATPEAIGLRHAGLVVCLVAIAIPLCLTVYDLIVVPLVEWIDRRRHPAPDAGEPQTLKQCIFAAIILPVTFLTTFVGMKASTAKAFGSVDQVTNAMESDGTFDRVSFHKSDRDGDGLLSYEEFHTLVVTSGGPDAELPDAELKSRFAMLDVDGTGKVSRRECMLARAAWRDGSLDFSEFEALVRMDPAAKGLSADAVRERWAALDVDGTGRVSIKEFALARAAWRDGELDFAEFCALMRTTGADGPHHCRAARALRVD